MARKTRVKNTKQARLSRPSFYADSSLKTSKSGPARAHTAAQRALTLTGKFAMIAVERKAGANLASELPIVEISRLFLLSSSSGYFDEAQQVGLKV